MMVVFVLTLSIFLQCAAAVMAFRLIPLTGKRLAWSLIAAALMFMALRRSIPLIRILAGDTTIRPDLNAELIALGISLLMVVGILGIAPIFKERRRAERMLGESEIKYRSIFENAVEGIYQATMEGKFISVNPAFARMLGYDSPGELIGSVTDIPG